MRLQKWNKTEAASSSYSFQEVNAVYSRLVITCGTGPAGTEIRLWSCRRILPPWTWSQAALAGEVPGKCKVGDTTGVNTTITVQITVSSLSNHHHLLLLLGKLFFFLFFFSWWFVLTFPLSPEWRRKEPLHLSSKSFYMVHKGWWGRDKKKSYLKLWVFSVCCCCKKAKFIFYQCKNETRTNCTEKWSQITAGGGDLLSWVQPKAPILSPINKISQFLSCQNEAPQQHRRSQTINSEVWISSSTLTS